MLSRETIDAFKRGEGDAFAQVMRTYADVVRGAAVRFFPSIFDQEEAMQEVWLHIYKNRHAVDAGRAAELSGFIAVTARRKCIDILRRTDPARVVDDIEAMSDEAEVDRSTSASAAEIVRAKELVAAAREFAQTLKPSWRAFFELCFVEGASFEDIGERLGLGKLRCKYMKKVIAKRARADGALLAALGRGGSDAPKS